MTEKIQITLRLYAELNDYLAPTARSPQLTLTTASDSTVAELIDRLGIPMDQVDMLLVNGISVCPEYILQNGDRLALYPVFEAFDISCVQHVRERPLREPRFLLDCGLDRLADALKARGFDVKISDAELESDGGDALADHGRIFITSEESRLARANIIHGLVLRSDQVADQLAQISERLHLMI